ncbi:MAG: hypothetical protein HC874_07320 [Richelia sp. SL_2_1]|nr:hypothetical protein [Richelia sp. SL_2_1]
MSTRRNISNKFWIDVLTNQRYANETLLPNHVDKTRFQFWDSDLEHSCYYHLLKHLNGRQLIRQSETIILPPKYPFKKLSWNCDFELLGNNSKLIECKGAWIKHDNEALANFVKILRFLSIFNPLDFERLIIVSDKRFTLIDTSIQVHSFNELPDLLN